VCVRWGCREWGAPSSFALSTIHIFIKSWNINVYLQYQPPSLYSINFSLVYARYDDGVDVLSSSSSPLPYRASIFHFTDTWCRCFAQVLDTLLLPKTTNTRALGGVTNLCGLSCLTSTTSTRPAPLYLRVSLSRHQHTNSTFVISLFFAFYQARVCLSLFSLSLSLSWLCDGFGEHTPWIQPAAATRLLLSHQPILSRLISKFFLVE